MYWAYSYLPLENIDMRPSRDAQRDHITIRAARAGDLPHIVKLYAQLFSNTDQAAENGTRVRSSHYDAFAEIEKSETSFLLVAEAAEAVVGTLAITIVPNVSHCGKKWAVIENVVVDKQARKSRIGSVMMRHALALARARGCFRVVLSSSIEREGSHKFYRTLGFDVFGYSFTRFLST
jgi:predicted N-acetyltransferase YhbS